MQNLIFAENKRAGYIQEWILYQSDMFNKYPVVAVYFDKDDESEVEKNRSLFTANIFYQVWQKNFRVFNVSYTDFAKEYFYLPANVSNENKVEYFFFDKTGVFLFSQKSFNERSVSVVIFEIWRYYKNDLEQFLKTGKSNISYLHWPEMAYVSGMPALTRKWLNKLNSNMLSKNEKKAFYVLKELY